jgi:tRNA1Val (adenine37-N6)-methyltransferase
MAHSSRLKASLMSNSYFQFKEFTVYQERCVMKVTTDACLFGAWAAAQAKRDKGSRIATNVLDVGTGTGLLSLMLAQKDAGALVDAIEIDEEAYDQAKENVAISPYPDQIQVTHTDVKSVSFLKKYDLIISNPPFYDREIESENAKKNVAHHNSGLRLEELLPIIKTNLAKGGIFYLLLPFKRNEEIKKILLRENLVVSKIVFVRQSTSHDYFRIMISGKLNNGNDAETVIDEISICDDQQQYTDQFKQLLQAYYLYL